MINVLIAEDNNVLATQLSHYLIYKDKNINILDIINDGSKVINSYIEHSPDVIILDISLPNKNGVEILDYLCKLNYKEKNICNIVIISGELHTLTLNYISKVYKIFEKPFCFEELYYAIIEVYTNNLEKNFEILCKNEIINLGFNPANIGTRLIIEAICMQKMQNTIKFNLNEIYAKLGKKYNISERNVRWNIEKAIDSMYRYAPKNIIDKFFMYCNNQKPTPKSVISMILEELTYYNIEEYKL